MTERQTVKFKDGAIAFPVKVEMTAWQEQEKTFFAIQCTEYAGCEHEDAVSALIRQFNGLILAGALKACRDVEGRAEEIVLGAAGRLYTEEEISVLVTRIGQCLKAEGAVYMLALDMRLLVKVLSTGEMEMSVAGNVEGNNAGGKSEVLEFLLSDLSDSITDLLVRELHKITDGDVRLTMQDGRYLDMRKFDER